MYRVEAIFRFNQDDTLPDCIKDVHRVANTDYFSILAGMVNDVDWNEVYTFLSTREEERKVISFYIESLREYK